MLKLRMTHGVLERGNCYKLYVNLTFHSAYTFWFCRFLLHCYFQRRGRAGARLAVRAGAAGLLPPRRIEVRCCGIKIPQSQIELCSAALCSLRNARVVLCCKKRLPGCVFLSPLSPPVSKLSISLMSGEPTRIELHKEAHIEIHQLAFSRHTESKGIMDLIEFLSPKHVILVHGEKPLMAFLKERVESELGMPCYYPANNESSPFGQPRTTKERHGKVRYKLHR